MRASGYTILDILKIHRALAAEFGLDIADWFAGILMTGPRLPGRVIGDAEFARIRAMARRAAGWEINSIKESRRRLAALRNVGVRFDCYPINHWVYDDHQVLTW